MTGVVLFSGSLCAGLAVWLLGMRPYLQRRGGTVVTGATFWLGAWADWQQCREFARTTRDLGASRWAGIFLLTQLAAALGIALMIWNP
ncbi:MAG: hypothetical protein ACREIC_08840 [Limisphaerales bacterium]